MPLTEQEKICRERILSEDYLDLIYEFLIVDPRLDKWRSCSLVADERYGVVYVSGSELPPYNAGDYGFRSIPSLFSPQDTTSMSASGILRAQNQPLPGLRGQGVLLGLIDTGVDYTHPAFRNPDGSTRLVRIWDQTIQSDSPPAELPYGTEYTEEEFNAALRTAEPFSLVPTMDESGHGTFLLGIAGGSETADGSFIGAAPEAFLAAVKLKPAKKNLRDYYFVPEDAEVYQENDIMLGVRYLRLLQRELHLPLVICVGLGTNRGGHDGFSPLEEVLTRVTDFPASVPVVCTGNDGNSAHHFFGRVDSAEPYHDVEIQVPEGERGFWVELWGQAPQTFSVGVISPGGESISQIPARIGRNDVFTFVLEPTRLWVDYSLASSRSGSQLISLGFETPTPGVWIVRVYHALQTEGYFHMWLPISGQLAEGTAFLRPDPEITLAIPSTSAGAIGVGGYNHRNDSFYINSGRGFTRQGTIKPALAAPCVEVYGPIPGGRYGRRTGTSIAAAHVAGAAADLLTWGVVKGNERSMDSNVIRSYLIRGVRRLDGFFYPNPETGYGLLDLYGVFQRLISF